MPIDNDSKINYPVTKAIAVGMENGSTVEYAINSIKADLPYKGTVPTGTDILTLNVPGVYLLASDCTYTNCPTSFGVLEIVKHEANPNQVLRMYRITDEEAIYTRYYVSDSETGEWNKQPTRDELDTITENMVLADLDSPIDTGNVNLYYTKTEVDAKDSALSGRIDTLSSSKADKVYTVSDVSYDTTAKKITKTVNGTTSDIVTAAALKTDMALDNVGNFKAVSTAANQGLSETEKANARSNIGAGNSSFSGSYNDLTDKPTLGTAAAKDVPSSGNASTSQVVMGNDTRLTDSRNAKDVYSWAKASVKPSYTASEVGAIPSSSKGANNGVAELDSAGKVPSSQLPSYVDDAIEANSMSDFPATGETGKIYIAKDTNKTYRWSGTGYVEISASLALGTTSSTAYRGDYGNAAYTHAVTNKGSAFSSGFYKIATNGEGHVTGATAVAKSDITALGIPAQDTTYSNATTSAAGLMSAADKTKLDGMATISYGTCQTAAATAAKAVTLTNANWQLKAGSIVGVDFTYTNTASASSSSPITLNVNGSGAKTIRYNHAIIAGAIPEVYGLGGHSIFYIYDGTYWNWLSIDHLSYRPIQVNGTEVYAGDNILPLKLKNGSNVNMSYSNGEVTVSATDTTYSNATTSTSGLMSSADKTRVDDMYEDMLIADLDSPIDTGNVNLYYTKTEVDAKDSALSGRIDTLNSNVDNLNSKSVGANAGGHNSIFRGKNLGTAVTAAQWAAISAGTFDDLFVGDYWVINGVNWRIAALDYWLNCGDQNCTTHHAVIVPDSNLLNGDGSTTHWMNTSNTTEGGYMGTGWYTGENADGTANTGKSQCLSKAESAFGSGHILQHREYLSNAVANRYVSGGTWADSKIELMNESMVYGNRFFENVINGTNIPAAFTIDKGQLPLFALAPQYICNRAPWWLRSVVSSPFFAFVHSNGNCDYSGASATWIGLRPAFGIK